MSEKKPWGILTGEKNHYYLVEETTSIGRDPKNQIVIDDDRISLEHCSIVRGQKQPKIIDNSSEGTYLNSSKIGKSNEVLLKNADIIHLLYMVSEDKRLGFTLHIIEQEKTKKKKNGKEKETSVLEDLDKDLICAICNELVYQCVMLYPCLHNFCGGCVSLWLKQKPECPNCRAGVKSAQKNHTIQNIVNKILKENPQKKRNENDLLELAKQNDIKNKVVKYSKSKQNQVQQLQNLENGQEQAIQANYFFNHFDFHHHDSDEQDFDENEVDDEYDQEHEDQMNQQEDSSDNDDFLHQQDEYNQDHHDDHDDQDDEMLDEDDSDMHDDYNDNHIGQHCEDEFEDQWENQYGGGDDSYGDDYGGY